MRHPAIVGITLLALLAGACSVANDPVLVETDSAPPAVTDGATSSTGSSESDAPLPSTATAGDTTDATGELLPTDIALATVEVIERRGHDTAAFTQGLLFHEGRLFESRGLYGESALTEIDPITGDVIRRVEVDPNVFAEGLAQVGDRLIQLTWRAELAYVYDLETFDLVDTFTYAGEGWGLCHDGADLWMSNGTSVLTRRSPETFEAIEEIEVVLAGRPLEQLNELECIDGFIWANVWQTDLIVIIDPATGQVISQVNADNLLTDGEQAAGAEVLNGIAYDTTTGQIVLTGKRWPAMFVVDIVPCDTGC